ncbi:MAG TPA: Hsp33 family molecular chaperone HslO [Gammaproteobacteria bacterium]|jgi:molecular chaperone Hsp33|nr:Hsp33 family molecular chaperone HslO [Gammaproteobacteria bacterium]
MPEQDVLVRFLLESADVRGVYARLDQSWREALSRANYPTTVQRLLGEAMAATALLSASIKFSGKLTLQVKGDGPVRLLVVQVTQQGHLRGLADWRNTPPAGPLSAVLGSAQMVISITGTESQVDYQGIVALEGETLADALCHYFARSEQLDTQLRFHVTANAVTGFLLQKLPGVSKDPDGWDRAQQLAATLQPQELATLGVEDLLHRLYHEEVVRVFPATSLRFLCHCSRQRVATMILGLGKQEAQAILQEQGVIEVTCEFCNAQHRFNDEDVKALFTSAAS